MTESLQSKGPVIPELAYALFHGMFACFTATLVSGAAIWKDRPGHFLVFILFWTTFVYNPMARWTWNLDCWSNTRGILDFAGGTPVHICAAATVLAHSIYHLYLPDLEVRLCKLFRGSNTPGVSRADTPDGNANGVAPIELRSMPAPGPASSRIIDRAESDNLGNMLLGTFFLWIGCFGFNGGSALGANLRAVSACISTHLSACAGAVTLCVWRSFSRYYKAQDNGHTGTMKVFSMSIRDFCNGAVIGLVAITPAAGYVPHTVSPLFGSFGVLFCAPFTQLGNLVHDTYSIVIVHGLGGFVGMFSTGVFATKSVVHLDGLSDIRGGAAWEGNGNQIG